MKNAVIHPTSIVEDGASIGHNVVIGPFCVINSGAKIGNNCTIGSYCEISNDVTIGDNTVVKSYVELRPDTIIGADCYIDSRVSSSGKNRIGNNVTLRYDTIIARGVSIGDETYVCPRVMTNNLNDSKNQIGGAKIGKNCFIGTNTVLQYGIDICDNVVIGSMSLVLKDISDPGIYFGAPCKKTK